MNGLFGRGSKISKAEKKKLKENKKKTKQLAKLRKKEQKQGNKNKGNNKSKAKNNDIVRVAEKEHVSADVRLFKYMPIALMLAVFCFIIGFGDIGWQNHQYKVAQGKLAMPNNTQLPLFKGQSKGTLTLKNAILSQNHKQIAVSIGYDDDAHKQLSSFGNKYKLWLIAPNGYPVQGVRLKYGFFGTDGNGILQINSDKPLPNQAFVVVIVDAGHLVTTEQIETGSDSYTDDDINQSITSQLATGNTDSSDESSSSNGNKSNNTPPMYYVRINPYSIQHTNINWGNNDRELVESLFVKHNLKKIRKKINKDKKQLKEAENTREEYEDRLKINPQDQTAAEGKDSLDSTINSLQQSINTQQKNYERISKARFGENILGKQQTKHHNLLTNNMEYFTNSGTKQ